MDHLYLYLPVKDGVFPQFFYDQWIKPVVYIYIYISTFNISLELYSTYIILDINTDFNGYFQRFFFGIGT